jgi:diketogulonate reductase-like aldo/keto reductase
MNNSPAILYGTAWKEERTAELTGQALASGFVGIDTANQRRHYHEAGVGDAVSAAFARGVQSRGDLFLQTKFTYASSQDHRIPYDPEASFTAQVRQSFEASLGHLRTDYIDSYLLHGPSSARGLWPPDWEVWRALESLQREGRAMQIGVSNFSLRQLAELHRYAEIKPAVVQNRCLARLGWDREIREFCRQNGISYQGFSLLSANALELDQPPLHRLMTRTGKSLPQIVFRFATQMGIVPLTGTTSTDHMRDALACFEFELDPAEAEGIERLEC